MHLNHQYPQELWATLAIDARKTPRRPCRAAEGAGDCRQGGADTEAVVEAALALNCARLAVLAANISIDRSPMARLRWPKDVDAVLADLGVAASLSMTRSFARWASTSQRFKLTGRMGTI